DRGLALAGTTEILAPVCQLSSDFVGHLSVERMLANRKVLPELLRRTNTGKRKELLSLLAKFTPLPGRLYDLALGRGAWSKFHGEVYLDRPNILSYYASIGPEADEKRLLSRVFDMLAKDVA